MTATAFLENKKAEVLGSVAGCVIGNDAEVADVDFLAVAELAMREGVLEGLAFIVGAEIDRRAGGGGELTGTTGEVGVDMSFEDRHDLPAPCGEQIRVDVYVAPGIDNHSAALGGEDVGEVREAFGFNSFEKHSLAPFQLLESGFHSVQFAGAHDLAQLFDDRIADAVNDFAGLPATGDETCIKEGLQVATGIGLGQCEGRDKGTDAAIAV